MGPLGGSSGLFQKKFPVQEQFDGQLRPGSDVEFAGQSFFTPPQHHELAGQSVHVSASDS
eukprot:2429861-Rhodomonas_salina.1